MLDNKKLTINSLVRAGEYNKAIAMIDEKISHVDASLQPAFYESLVFLKKLCLKKISEGLVISKVNNKNNIILLINPSHAHDHECSFWTEFVVTARAEGFEVVDLNYRKVEPFSGNVTLVNPARCRDLANKYKNYSNESLPSWCNETMINVYEDWEHRRWEIKKYDPNVKKGVASVACYIEDVINQLNPCAIITSNKIDWPNQCGYLAAKDKGIPYFFFERSPLDSHLIESEGMFSESDRINSLFETLDCNIEKLVDANSLISSLNSNPYGFRADEATRSSFDDCVPGKKLFFLPLDNILWTAWGIKNHKQGYIDYPIFKDPIDALTKINNEVKNLGGYLVVKPHPSCKEFKAISEQLSDICFSEADLSILLDHSDVVVTFLTKVSYVAMAKKKPVVSFGSGLLDGLGITYEVNHPEALGRVLSDALSENNFDEKYNRFKFFLPHLNAFFHETGRDGFYHMYGKFGNGKQIDTEGVQKLLIKTKLHDKVNETNGKDINFSNKPALIFDVSRLTNGRLKYSGVTRYTNALLEEVILEGSYDVYFGAFFANNDFGKSASIIQDIEEKFGKKVYPMKELVKTFEDNKYKYILHTPINPEILDLETKYAKKVITVHDILHLTEKHYSGFNSITERIVNSILDKKPSVIFVSDYSSNEFTRYTNSSLRHYCTTHLGVDKLYQPTFSPIKEAEKASSKKAKIVMPFQADPRKGFAKMLRVCNDLAAQGVDAEFVSYGSKSKKFMYIEAIDNEVDASNLHLFKFIESPSDYDLARLYTDSTLFLYLSESEGFGLPPLEAMRCGCPAILLDNTSLSEVYEGWPLKLESSKQESVTQTINAILSDNEKLRTLRTQAIEFSSKYHWRITASKTVNFYNKTLDL
tara:strand:+ start:5173 stop:7791 length:2619 start_codon:yes stop_codon:yes gene_type:complete